MDIFEEIAKMNITDDLGSQDSPESQDFKALVSRYRAAVDKSEWCTAHSLLEEVLTKVFETQDKIIATLKGDYADLQKVVELQAQLIRKHEAYEKILEAKSERQ